MFLLFLSSDVVCGATYLAVLVQYRWKKEYPSVIKEHLL